MRPAPPPHRSPFGRCQVCGSATPYGRARCEIHPEPVWPKVLFLLLMFAAVVGLMALDASGPRLRLVLPW